MGLGGSSCLSEEWCCDPHLPPVEALSRLFFHNVGQRPWDLEVSTVLSLLEQTRASGPKSQAVADREWWTSHIASIDEEAAHLVFDVMAVDPAGRQVNMVEVVSCATLLSPHLRKEWKLATLYSLFASAEEGMLSIEEVTNMCCCLLRGLHRLAVLLYSPPPFEDIENDLCRLLWVLRKNQPYRGDVFAVEEALCLTEIDQSLKYLFEAFGGGKDGKRRRDSSASRQEAATSAVEAVAGGTSSTTNTEGSGRPPLPRSKTSVMARAGSLNRQAGGRQGSCRPGEGRSSSQAPRRGASKEAKATVEDTSTAEMTPVSSVRASAVLSRREVLEAFDTFRDVCAELDRMPRGAKRDSTTVRAVAKISNAQVQLSVKRILAKGQPLALRDFLRLLAVSKAPAAFTEGHLPVFERWIAERASLNNAELAKYGLDKGLPPIAPPKNAARGSDRLVTATRRKMQVLSQRVFAQPCQAWITRQRAALADPKGAESRGKPRLHSELTLTLADMVMQGVMPEELATAAARTFGWDETRELSEGAFLELLVPVPRDDYHSLDFMRAFRRAWLTVNNPPADVADPAMASPSSPSKAGGSPNWMFQDSEVDAEAPEKQSAAADPKDKLLRPHSAPPVASGAAHIAPGCVIPPLPQARQIGSLPSPAEGATCGRKSAEEKSTSSQYDNDEFERLSEGPTSPQAFDGHVGYEELVQRRSADVSVASSFAASGVALASSQ
mmetsp:Transcript_27362/g.63844  ORF Transcript_27362/g.63844 Transcript_27362/m.63844 type:complete len:724 (-) Transcript_27362:111-2282(-)